MLLTATEQAWAHVWLEAHDIAEREMLRLKSGTCQQPGLAALLANFATKVALAEREACAKIAEQRAQDGEYGTWQGQEGLIIAAAIRERS